MYIAMYMHLLCNCNLKSDQALRKMETRPWTQDDTNRNTSIQHGDSTMSTLSTTYTPIDMISALQPYFITSIPCILLSMATITLNILVIDYYLRSRRSFVPLLYMMISAVDILTAVGLIHQSIVTSIFTRGIISERALDTNAVFCYTLISLSYKSSIFYNVVLAVSRTIMIRRPFHQIRIKAVMGVCVAYGLIWVALATYDIYNSYFIYQDFSRSVYYRFPVVGMEIIHAILGNDIWPGAGHFFLVLFLVVPFLLPVLITLVTCVIQVFSLHSPNVVTNKNQRHVTITVILMSALFVVCNSAFSVYILLYAYSSMSGKNFELLRFTR